MALNSLLNAQRCVVTTASTSKIPLTVTAADLEKSTAEHTFTILNTNLTESAVSPNTFPQPGHSTSRSLPSAASRALPPSCRPFIPAGGPAPRPGRREPRHLPPAAREGSPGGRMRGRGCAGGRRPGSEGSREPGTGRGHAPTGRARRRGGALCGTRFVTGAGGGGLLP